MINDTTLFEKFANKLAQVIALRHQIYAYVCVLLVVAAWNETYRLMIQFYAILIIFILSNVKVSVRLSDEISEHPTKRKIIFPLLLCALVGFLVGSLFSYLNHALSATTSTSGIMTDVLLLISATIFFFVPQIIKSSQSDRQVVWSIYVGITFFFTILGSLLQNMLVTH